ncbi:MAG: MarR family transcriptional regulator [Actinomycetota bacterium]|nr:MarR family transcriptional regulator [Actinomycetota bacterium]
MDTVNSGSPVAAESSLRLVDEFAGFGPTYMKWVKSRLQDRGMTYARMRLLGALHCNGPQIMTSISDELGVTRRNVTTLVDALEEEGLVRREPHPTDRRATVIEMTEQGARTMDRMYDEHRAEVAGLFHALSEEDRQELARLLGVLRQALQQEGACG